MARKILIFGASYGALLGAKLALAGHGVTLVCTARTAGLINAEGIVVRMPVPVPTPGRQPRECPYRLPRL